MSYSRDVFGIFGRERNSNMYMLEFNGILSHHMRIIAKPYEHFTIAWRLLHLL